MSEPLDQDAQDPVMSEESKDSEFGVDASLVAWMLSLSPVERLEYLQVRIPPIVITCFAPS